MQQFFIVLMVKITYLPSKQDFFSGLLAVRDFFGRTFPYMNFFIYFPQHPDNYFSSGSSLG